MIRSARRTVQALCLAFFGLCGACKSDAPPATACTAGTRAVGTTCVPSVFGDNDLAVTDAGLLAVDKGVFYSRETLIVLLRDPKTPRQTAADLFTRHGGRIAGAAPFLGFYQVRFADATTPALLDAKQASLAAEAAVEFAMRDIGLPRSLTADLRPKTPLERLSDASEFQPMWGEQDEVPPKAPIGTEGTWAWKRVGFPEAWDALYTGNPRTSPVTVAILDGELAHDPAFGHVRFSDGDDHRPKDGKEPSQRLAQHATAVAAIIAAPSDENRLLGGITSGLACQEVTLSPHIVAFKPGIDDPVNGVTQASALTRGLIAAVNAGARVINTSAGLALPNADAKAAADLAKVTERLCAEAPGVVFVFSAGNDSSAGAPFDASNHVPSNVALVAKNAISVGAISRSFIDGSVQDVPKESSNVDPTGKGAVTLAAPGADVLTLLPSGGLTKFGGTSAAAPFVSGTAAMVLQINPKLSGAEVRMLLLESADSVAMLAPISGRRLNARAAVEKALATLPADQQDKGTCRAQDAAAPKTDAGTFVSVCGQKGFCGTHSLCPPGRFYCATSSLCYATAEELLAVCAGANCRACEEPPVPWCTSDECRACAERGGGLFFCPADKTCTSTFNDYAKASCPMQRCTCKN